MELSEIRQQIDQIDNEIIRLFLQRMHCSEEVARYKIQNGKAVFTYDDAYITYNNGEKEEAHQVDVRSVEGGKDYWGFQHAKQISEFYKAVLEEKPLEISGEEALKTHKLIMEIYSKGKECLKK